MQIDALGYVGIQTADLEQWATYGTRFLGIQLVGKSHGTLALRMDDRKQRVIVHAGEGEGISFYEQHRPARLDPARARRRAELVGARPHVADAGGARRGA